MSDALAALFAPEACPALLRVARPRAWADGAWLFHEGDDADALYYLVQGRVRIELERGELDSDAVLAHVPQGSVVGELGLLDGGRRSAGAVADGPVQALELTRAALTALEAEDPATAMRVWRALGAAAAAKLRLTNDRLASALFATKDPFVSAAVAAGRAAQSMLASASEAEVDALLAALAQVIADHAAELAQLTVETTGLGHAGDKTRKNHFASLGVLAALRGQVGAGPLGAVGALAPGVQEIAAPAGLVFGLIPVTNPVATAIFKTLICLKSRNALLLSFPRRAAAVGQRVAALFAPVLAAHGQSAALVQCLTGQSSRQRTAMFFAHRGVDLILATGGGEMVRAAYASGRPALGVGAGNAPTLVAADADLPTAAAMIVESKSYDHGLICGSEHHLIVVASVRAAFIAALEAAGAAVLESPAESARGRAALLSDDGAMLRPRHLGRGAAELAALAGIVRAHPIRLLVLPATPEEARAGCALASEKMAPVLSLFTVPDAAAGTALAVQLLILEGAGHTAAIHTRDESLALAYATAVPASRILVNTPATHGVIGLTTGLTPSLTLGCGYFGGNSTNDNVTHTHVRNVKRLAYHRPPPASAA